MKLKLLVLVLITSHVFLNGQSYKQSSDEFKSNCDLFIPDSEESYKCWYHYVISKKDKSTYILRVFYPQTKQLTAQETYANKKLKKKEGPAKYWFENGNKRSEGTFVNNRRSGYWKTYNIDSGNLSSEGDYANGQQTGEWKNYNSDGSIKSTVTFRDDLREGPFTEFDSLGQSTNTGIYKADTIFSQTNKPLPKTQVAIEIMPFLKQCSHIEDLGERKNCSDHALIRYIQENIKYPQDARKYGIEGRGFAQFTIRKTGEISDIKPIVTHCEQIKQELIRMINNLPEFSPGLQNGEAVDVFYTLPFTFRLK